jgi:hypothetical protein
VTAAAVVLPCAAKISLEQQKVGFRPLISSANGRCVHGCLATTEQTRFCTRYAYSHRISMAVQLGGWQKQSRAEDIRPAAVTQVNPQAQPWPLALLES